MGIGYNRNKLFAKGGEVAKVGEPYDSMTKYQLEKEYKKLEEKISLLRRKYGDFESDEIAKIDKELDKIITLLYGENFSGVGQKYKYAKGGSVNLSDISVYVPNRNILSITIEKDGKEMKLTGSDIMDGLYVKDGEFKRGGFIKTLRRWWKKLNGTWYYNEGNGWRRDRAFQNKSEDYEKGGRKTYKQVTRGYVDDTPYEYAKGGSVEEKTIVYGKYKNNNTDDLYFFSSESKGLDFLTNHKNIDVISVGQGKYDLFYGWDDDKQTDGVLYFGKWNNGIFGFNYSGNVKYAKGGYVDIEGKLLKELQKLQRDLNSSRLQTYIEGDNSEEAMANKRERASKMARFNEVLAMLNDIQAKRKDGKFARGGVVVTSIKEIPNFQEELNAGRITYRGLGMGKVADDFYKLAGESGTRIKVKGKEYYITDTEFDTFSRDSSGKLRVKFDAPFRKFAKGGDVEIPEKIEYSSMFSPIPRSTDNEKVV